MTAKTTTPRKQQNFRLDEPTREALRIIGEIEKRSQAQIIEIAVEEYFCKHYDAAFWERRAQERAQ